MQAMTAAPQRRVLILEDEPDVASLIALHMGELPAAAQIESDGREGLRVALEQGPWDLLVLDLSLPSLGGLEVCRALRLQGNDVPILILTARGSELDRVLGLELGADDYLTKPFGVMELQARVRALWRRTALRTPTPSENPPAEPEVLQVAALRIDRVQRKAWLAAQELTLTPREFSLLWHFAHQPGRAFSRSDLLAAVWGYGHDGYDHTVNTHINRLRKKLGEGYIATVWGVGYRFQTPV
jgi:DNA-binding response OmpR family regulator